jgi:hypothetical protein
MEPKMARKVTPEQLNQLVQASASNQWDEAIRHCLADALETLGRIGEAMVLRGNSLLRCFADEHVELSDPPHALLAYDRPQGDPHTLSLLSTSRRVGTDFGLRIYQVAWLPRMDAQMIFDQLLSEGGWRTSQRVLSMEDVRDAEAMHRGPCFGSDCLRMFDSRLHELHHGPGGVFFVTAGYDAEGTSRRFRVREFHPTRPEAGSLISVRSPEVEHQFIESALVCAKEHSCSTRPQAF